MQTPPLKENRPEIEARIVPSIPEDAGEIVGDPLGDILRDGAFEERVEVHDGVTRRVQTWTRKTASPLE